METRSYAVTILSGPENDPEDAFNPKCYSETYEEAVSIARPWVDQGYYVTITKYENESKEGSKN